jgi:signal transduction histidine kinase
MPNSRNTYTSAQELAIEHQLTATLIENTKAGIYAGLMSTPVIVALLAGHVNTLALGLWVLAVSGIAVYRLAIVRHYTQSYAATPSAEGQAYISQRVWTWSASALLWGSAMFLYLGRAPLTSQFVCLMVLVGMGGNAVSIMTPRMDCFRGYINALILTACAAIVWRLSQTQDQSAFLLGLLALLGIFWWLLLGMGERSHQLLRRSFELRITNTQLIESLLAKTRAANEAVEVKDRFLAQAAHDLRQPVHALAFYADWLRTEPQLSSEVVPKILQCTDSVHALFDSLFDFARLDAGVLTPRMQAVDVRELVNQVILPIEHTATAKGLSIRTHVHQAQVRSDAILLRRVVGNLVSNAVRYAERGGVLISTRRRGEQLWLEVWDTGVGIAPLEQNKVFDEFYKVRQHSGTEEGFGLGLAIVKRLSQMLGIGLSLKSRPGRGTCVRLVLPLAATEISTPALKRATGIPPASKDLEQAAATR